MKKHMISALSVALFAVTSGAAVAGHGHHGGEHDGKHRAHRGAGMHESGDPGRMVGHLTRELDLDETQQQEIDNVVLAARPQMDALRERADANRKAFHELDLDSEHDAKLNALAVEKGAIATEHALLHGRLKADIRAVLTPAQRQQLFDQAQAKRERYQRRQDERSPIE
ncbi:MAG: Spy/CpxP family protein refolding chaperone [Woeseia sp.]